MRRRSFSRRPARRAQWLWGTNNNITITAGNTDAQKEILPSRRVQFLLEANNRPHLVHVKTLLWVQVAFESGATGGAPPTGAFYIVKTSDNATANYSPFAEPEVPNAIANWDATAPTNSADPYLWVTRLWQPGSYGSINGAVQSFTIAGVSTANTTAVWGDWGSHVQSLFYPNVELNVKRRLMKNEGLTFGLHLDAAVPATCAFVVNYALRMLIK